MGDRWRFVDSISATPTVRLDLNDETIWAVRAANTSPPPLRRQVVQSFALDGGTVPATAYDNRVVGLSLELLRATEDAAATQRQLLARELARDTNFLEYRPTGATSSVFFRTYRSEPESFERVVSASAYQTFDVPLLAEPWAYGLKQTLANVTLANNPTSANGLEFTIPAANVIGDIETPLCLKFADATKLGSSGAGVLAQTMISSRRRGTVASMPFIFQAEAATQGTDTTTQVNSASFSGAGNNWSRCTFGTTTGLATRLTFTVPAAATKEARGTYRVLLKCRVSANPSVVTVMYQTGSNASDQSAFRTLTNFTTTDPAWLDLGLLTLPVTQDPHYDGPSGTELSVGTDTLQILVGKTSGTTNFDVDFLALVPADDNMCFVKWPDGLSASNNAYLDGYNRVAYIGTDTEVRPSSGYATSPTGYVMLTPNQDNRILTLPDVTEHAIVVALTQTHTVTPYYWPRYIDVRPATT